MTIPTTIPLWPNGAPGTADWKQREVESITSLGSRILRNVTAPTLTAFLPDPAQANGTSVIVAPGGAFPMLSIENVYAKGGHGFGMRKQGLPTDRWIERFGEWMELNGWM